MCVKYSFVLHCYVAQIVPDFKLDIELLLMCKLIPDLNFASKGLGPKNAVLAHSKQILNKFFNSSAIV